jgi:hypothetical protein
MTTVLEQTMTCGLCGNEQAVTELGSTNTFGPMDLDTRPAEMKRSTMEYWIYECDQCGFVATDLEESVPTDKETVASAGYVAALRSASRKPLANQFVCRSLLDAAAGDLASAGWRRLHAAWVCDDQNSTKEAQALRLAAIELLERSRSAGKPAMEKMAGGDELLLCDLARRAGEFPRAIEYCEAGLKLEVQPFIRQILELEQKLCVAGDAACHNVGEVETA